MNTTTSSRAAQRSPALSKIRGEWPAVARHIEVGEPLHQVRTRVDQMPTSVAQRNRIHDVLDVLDHEIARGDFDDPTIQQEEGSGTLTDPARVMAIVHEEARAQNGWDVLGISFIGLDQETGIVRFRHGAGQFGTAFFRWYPDADDQGVRALFDHGHYGCDWPTSARDFCERVQREA